MKEEKVKLLSQVAYMHFVEGKSQSDIAKELGIYRTTISRMVKQARNEGIVEIKIHHFDQALYSLERHLKEIYGLKYISIVASRIEDTEATRDEILAVEAAAFLKSKIESKNIVGLAWGATIGETIAKLENRKNVQATFVPIVGGPSHINSRYHVNTLVYEMSRKFEGKSLFVNATVVQESRELKEGILGSNYFSELRHYWRQLDVAVVGIGGPLHAKESQWRDLLSSADYEELTLREAVGDCCCRFFDGEGKVLKGSLDGRTIGVELEQLSEVPIAVGIARSKTKARGILAMIKKQFINTLITDEETALEVLRLAKDPFYQEYLNRK